MRKIYRISVRNASNDNKRELLYATFTSRKTAQEVCDKINAIQSSREAYVVVS